MKTVYLHYKYLQWYSNRPMIMIRVYSVPWNVIIRSYSLSQVTKICDLVKSQIKSYTEIQIKSFLLKSNHHMWFNHDLNQIMIWFCPSMSSTMHNLYCNRSYVPSSSCCIFVFFCFNWTTCTTGETGFIVLCWCVFIAHCLFSSKNVPM